jgi:hypothetical protein
MGDASVYVLRVMVVLKIFVVSPDLYLVTRPKQQVAPVFKGMDDSEEFPIVDVVAPFRRRQSMGIIADGARETGAVLYSKGLLTPNFLVRA